MKQLKITNIIIGIGLIVLSVYFFKLCAASILATRPQMAVANLERYAKPEDIEQIEQHLNRLKIAISLFPSEANFYTLTARYLRLLIKFSDDATYGNQAKEYFAQAVRLEPTSYVHRVRQAKFLYQKYGWSQEFDELFSVAIDIGKYEKLPQQILLPIAFENWQALSNSEQQDIHLMLDNMFSTSTHYFRQALRVASKHCALDLLASHVVNAQQNNEIDAKISQSRGCE